MNFILRIMALSSLKHSLHRRMPQLYVGILRSKARTHFSQVVPPDTIPVNTILNAEITLDAYLLDSLLPESGRPRLSSLFPSTFTGFLLEPNWSAFSYQSIATATGLPGRRRSGSLQTRQLIASTARHPQPFRSTESCVPGCPNRRSTRHRREPLRAGVKLTRT